MFREFSSQPITNLTQLITNNSQLNNMFGFQKLTVYQEARSLVKDVYLILEKYPRHENYALCDQLRRAVISVPSNIAEGVSRNSIKEKVRFLEIAYGSLMEVLCQLELSLDLGYLTNDEMNTFEGKIETIAKFISGLKKSIS